ncbi:MAG: hypothetical protein V4520_15575 [Bacteroidota bacterium]
MFNVFKKSPLLEFDIPGIGIFYQLKHPKHVFWSKTTDIFSIGQEVSLNIDTFNNTEPSSEQVLSIQVLTKQYDSIIEMVFYYLMEGDESSNVTIENFKQLYSLVKIELDANNTRWTYTFEPHYDMRGPYSYFVVIIIDKGKIVDYYET